MEDRRVRPLLSPLSEGVRGRSWWGRRVLEWESIPSGRGYGPGRGRESFASNAEVAGTPVVEAVVVLRGEREPRPEGLQHLRVLQPHDVRKVVESEKELGDGEVEPLEGQDVPFSVRFTRSLPCVFPCATAV